MRVLCIGGCGYVGGAIYSWLKAAGHEVDTVDLELSGNVINPSNIKKDYGKLSKQFLSAYEVIVLAAAHSSAGMCNGDPYGAFRNNVVNFVSLLEKLDRQKLIYASSSCVYSGSNLDIEHIENSVLPTPCDHLTLTKCMIDYYAQKSSVEYYGLRFGSVNGYTPNFRRDLMINAMSLSAMSSGVVSVSNKYQYRPILFIRALASCVEKVVDSKEDRRGIYNVANFNMRIGEIATVVAAHFGAKVEHVRGPSGYDFRIDSGRFQRAFGISPVTIDDIVSQIDWNREAIFGV
jgi:nucleoside-diphosphate-sugar epimerase